MARATPLYSRSKVDAAGAVLRVMPYNEIERIGEALVVLNNWRASHAFPLNTFQTSLRDRARRLDPDAVIAQRLKRLPSILRKLDRFPRMRLSQMQDIGGCRAVVVNVQAVRQLRDAYIRARHEHELVDEHDYITAPKPSGYRGIHLVYKYRSRRSVVHKDQLIEVQLRTPIQHAWATAVETVSTMLDHALKSSEGPEQCLRFFSLVSSAFARLEGTPMVFDAPANGLLIDEVRREVATLNVYARLQGYRSALSAVQSDQMRSAQYFLLSLKGAAAEHGQTLEVTGFRSDELQTASDAYLEEERRAANIPGAEVVLVRSESIEALRRAYPNYFLDTELFLQLLDEISA